MKRSDWSFGLVAAAAIAFTLVSRPDAAIAGNLMVEVSLPNGLAAPSSITVQFRDSMGKAGSCKASTLGFFKCKTTGFTLPYLLNGGTLYGYAESATGLAVVDGITDLGVNQIYQSWGTSPAAEWARMPAPWTIAPAVLNSANAWLDESYEFLNSQYKITSKIGYNFFNAKYSFKNGLGSLLPQLNYIGAHTATENVGATLPGGINFGAMYNAMPSANGSLASWTVGAGLERTYQSAYAKFPTSANLEPVYVGANKQLSHYLGTLHHEGPLLDSFNLAPYFSLSFLENGQTAGDFTTREATWLRKINVKSFTIGSLISFQENMPSAGSDLLTANVFKVSINHGVPCTDYCCYTFICASDGSQCQFYGNQRIAGMMGSPPTVRKPETAGGPVV